MDNVSNSGYFALMSRTQIVKPSKVLTGEISRSGIDLKLISWNIDGLCDDHIQLRAREAVRIIIEESPDVVFLQEVVEENCSIFSVRLLASGYVCAVPPPNHPYFTMCFTKKSSVIVNSATRVQFQRDAVSSMGRDILGVDISIGGQQLLCVSSHLESMKDSSATRTAQLAQLGQIIINTSYPALIVGDLNIRDKEAADAVECCRRIRGTAGQSVDVGFNDAYLYFGRPVDSRITWRPINGNASFSGCRFDRIYHNCHPQIEYESLALVGKSKGAASDMTPSDHFGLVVGIKLLDHEGSAPKSGNVGKIVTKNSSNMLSQRSMISSMPKSSTAPLYVAKSSDHHSDSESIHSDSPLVLGPFEAHEEEAEEMRRAIELSMTNVSYQAPSGAAVTTESGATDKVTGIKRSRSSANAFLAAFERREGDASTPSSVAVPPVKTKKLNSPEIIDLT